MNPPAKLTLLISIALATFTMAQSAPSEPSDEGPAVLDRAVEPMTGDLDAMRKLGRVRVLVSFSRTGFFVSEGRPRGFDCDLMTEYQQALLKQLKIARREMTVVFVPVAFEQLIPALLEGRGDIAAGGLTITPERQHRVTFSDPYLTNVDEIVVASKSARDLKTLDDLAGREVRIVRGSSYEDHLNTLSLSFERAGKPAIRVTEAAEAMEAEDLLELVHVGAMDLTVVDRHVAEAWAGVLRGIAPLPNLKVNTGGQIALAVRPNNPKLLESVNTFIRGHRRGTTIGNILFNRYYANTRWLQNPMTDQWRRKRDELRDLFQKYGKEYRFDWLLLAAQGFQESALDQSAKSNAGAVGIMQLLPATARELGFPSIDDPDNNIHAGAKYLAKLRDDYFNDPALKPAARLDFALAAYNAGPSNVKRWRDLARERGLDPNVWRESVERISLEKVGEQTYRYVRNIDKYYLIYTEYAASEAQRGSSRPR